MNELVLACESFDDFPKNILRARTNAYHRDELYLILEERDNGPYPLFDVEVNATLAFRDFGWSDNRPGFQSANCRNLDGVKKHLIRALEPQNSDPSVRFMFIQAQNSRAALSVTKDMLTFALSYHQVSPAFLEHIFPFGQQEYAKDFHFIRFKADNMIRDNRLGLKIPELGRSGQEIRLLYTLKSIESSPQQIHWPWSIRQVAVYHAFDIESGRATWIVVKGNKVMRERVLELSNCIDSERLEDLDRKFAFTLQAHILFCQWASETFLRYISFLEASVQKATRKALYTDIGSRVLPREAEIPSPVSRRTTLRSFTEAWTPKRSMTESTMGKKRPLPSASWKTKAANSAEDISRSLTYDREARAMELSIRPNITSSGKMMPPDLPPISDTKGEPAPTDPFFFGDLQYTQQLIEKIKEALLVVSLDHKVIAEIRKFYSDPLSSGHIPEVLKTEAISDFSDELQGIETDLGLLVLRFEALYALANDRKGIMLGFLEHSSLLANKELGKKAQESAHSMESLTKGMHWIARKTLEDTVSMKVITIVTLFFLPGTFISTLMSTSIVQYQIKDGQNTKIVSTEAVKLWFAITVPLMCVTFLGWWIVKIVEKKRRKWKELETMKLDQVEV